MAKTISLKRVLPSENGAKKATHWVVRVKGQPEKVACNTKGREVVSWVAGSRRARQIVRRNGGGCHHTATVTITSYLVRGKLGGKHERVVRKKVETIRACPRRE